MEIVPYLLFLISSHRNIHFLLNEVMKLPAIGAGRIRGKVVLITNEKDDRSC